MKGQHEVLMVIIIIGILFGVIASVWVWSTPIVEANKDSFQLRTTEDFIKDVAGAIKLVAKNGGKTEVNMMGLDPQGTIFIDPTGIDIITTTGNSIYEKNIQIPLGELNCATTEATWGINSSEVICVTSNSLGNEKTRTVFSLSFVQLDYDNANTQEKKAYKIIILPLTTSRGLNKNAIVIENRGLQQSDSNGRTLISTLIAISII